MARLAVERDRPGAIHGLKILLHFELVGLFSLTIVMVPLPCVLKASMVAGLKTAPSDPPASGRVVEDLAVGSAEDHHHGWAGWTVGISRPAAGGEEDMIFGVDRQAVTAAFVAERSSGPPPSWC